MLDRSSDLPGAPARDSLSEVLQELRLSGVSYGHCELTRPWGVEFAPEMAAKFHFVVDGECWLRTPTLGWTELHKGDVVLLPRGIGHALADRPRRRTKLLAKLPCEEIGDKTYRLSAGGGGARTLMACCSVSFEESALHPLLELMPPVMLVCRAATSDATLPVLLGMMAEEVVSHRVGGATVLTRLADLVIARLVRSWVEAGCQSPTGWLAAIRDPKIGRALAAVHRRPGDPWSVETLADAAGMSRSMFSERFATVVGVPPAQYLARWRMRLATTWLRNERLTVAEAAARLGYESEASFSRAFKRLLGVPPSSLRRVDRASDRSAA